MCCSSRPVAQVLTATMMPPSRQIARSAMIHSGLLPIRIATLSPLRTPSACRPLAKARTSLAQRRIGVALAAADQRFARAESAPPSRRAAPEWSGLSASSASGVLFADYALRRGGGNVSRSAVFSTLPLALRGSASGRNAIDVRHLVVGEVLGAEALQLRLADARVARNARRHARARRAPGRAARSPRIRPRRDDAPARSRPRCSRPCSRRG